MKPTNGASEMPVKFFDSFTKTMLIVMIGLLCVIFVSAKFMAVNNSKGGGTDDTVNAMAAKVTKTQAHPFIYLPGDSQVAAFSIANFFVGLIIGHNVETLFRKKKEGKEPDGGA